MNAQIHVTTRASDMNYVNKTHIYATRFDEQKAGWKRTQHKVLYLNKI